MCSKMSNYLIFLANIGVNFYHSSHTVEDKATFRTCRTRPEDLDNPEPFCGHPSQDIIVKKPGYGCYMTFPRPFVANERFDNCPVKSLP